MPRSFALALLLGACRAPAGDPVIAAAISPEPDPAAERLQMFIDAEVPSVVGWSRVRQIFSADRDGGSRCRNVWVQQQGLHRVVLADTLQIDYGGLWFAGWPAQMRVGKDTYAGIELPVQHSDSKAVRTMEPLAEQPSDLLEEVTRMLHAESPCRPGLADDPALSLVGAGWVHAMGHTELAEVMLREWNLAWSDEAVRVALAKAMLRFVGGARRQGMPRALLRPWLERTARICDCGASREAAAQLAVLGDDPSGPLDATDPQTLLAWLADDLVFPFTHDIPRHLRDELGWAPDLVPRSPALELHALGWAALPALVESRRPAQLMRAQWGDLRTTDDARRSIASFIALRRFDDDAAMRSWWATAKPHGELTAHLSALDLDDGFTSHRVQRVLALDRRTALVEIAGALAQLHPRVRSRVVLAVAEQVPRRAWLDRAIAAARMELAAPYDSDSEDLVADLVEVVARADPRRAAALMREVRRRERAAEHRDAVSSRP